MRWLLKFLRELFASRPSKKAGRGHLLGIYFEENNRSGRRRPNRDRA